MNRNCAVAVRRLACCALVALPLFATAAQAQEKATVVYVSGNQLVVKNTSNDLDYGYILGGSDTVKTDAGSVPVSGLKPGMVVTTDGLKGGTVVDDASVVSGKVVSLSPPNKMVVKVSDETKEVSVAGGVSGIKVGDSVDMTLVTIRTAGDNRPMNSVKTPALSGKLAFFQEPNMEQPDSGTNLPAYGVAGLALLALGFGLKLRRRTA